MTVYVKKVKKSDKGAVLSLSNGYSVLVDNYDEERVRCGRLQAFCITGGSGPAKSLVGKSGAVKLQSGGVRKFFLS